MTVLASAVLLLGAFQNDLQPAVADPRTLYLHAAKLLRAEPAQPAVQVLEELVQQHAQTYYSELAAFHLAECYVILGEPNKAVELLEQWKHRLRFPSKETNSLAPNLFTQAQALHTVAARAAASDYERQDDFRQAIELLHNSLRSAESADIPLIQHEIVRTAVTACLRALTRSDEVEDFLSTMGDEWQLPDRFALAESCIKEGLLLAAEDQLAWLSAAAARDGASMDLGNSPVDAQQDSGPEPESSYSSDDGKPEGRDYPDWAFTVALRRCELAVRQKQIDRAEKLIVECQDRYSDSDQSYQFDFLLARCAIAQVEFSTALKILQQIGAQESVPAPMHAKAFWMIGELHFLKQEFQLAIAAYRQALAIDAPAWQSRALLQMAKCQELSGQNAAAVRSYERLQRQFGETPLALQATARIAQFHKFHDKSGKIHQTEEK